MSNQLNNLGQSWHKYFLQSQNLEHLDKAISAYCLSATHNTGPPSVHFHAAQAWAHLAQTDTLEAFKKAIELLSQVAGLEQTVSKCYTNLTDVSHLTMSASAAAIDARENETALEWLEQGRCLVWNKIQQLRTPVKNLHAHNPSLANHFRDVATALEASGSRQTKPVLFSKETMTQVMIAQDENKRHAELAKEWNQLLDEIRALPDFSDFLRPPTASSLLAGLPCDGHVVIFNIHEAHCDALALISGADKPLHIPLPTFSHKQAVELRDRLHGYLKKQGVRVREAERAGRPFEQPKKGTQGNTIHMVLREIWECVVKPVFDALGYNNSVSCSLTRDRDTVY